MLNPLLVFAGGVLGTLARWLLTDALSPSAEGLAAQWGLLAANVLGAGLLGFFGSWFQQVSAVCATRSTRAVSFLAGREMLLLGTGFCGAFTSFSALAGVVLLIQDASLAAVLGYFAATVVLGVCAAAAGVAAGTAAGQSASRAAEQPTAGPVAGGRAGGEK